MPGPIHPHRSRLAALRMARGSGQAGFAPGDEAGAAGVRVELLCGAESLAAIRPAWDALWQREGGSYTLSAACCLAAWRHVHDDGAQRLMLASVFEGEALAAVWPLLLRQRGPWRMLTPLTPTLADCSALLMENTARAPVLAASLWQEVARHGGADLAVLHFVPDASPLGAVLRQAAGVLQAKPQPASILAWQKGETWDAYYQSLSPAHRRVQSKKRRRLSAAGCLTFEIVEKSAALPGLVAWLLAEKRGWSARTGNTADWLTARGYEAFLAGFAQENLPGARTVMFVLALDGAPVAAQLAVIHRSHIELIISGFSAAQARHSPGSVLHEYCLRFAHEHRLDVEFGIGDQENKKFWCRNGVRATTSYRVALTKWGRAGHAVSHMRRRAPLFSV